MKLSTVLASVNDNEHYYLFIPKQISFWKYFNINFIVIFVGEKIPESLQSYSDHIFLWNKNLDLHSAYVAQNIRIYYPALIPNLKNDEMVMITDMDMLPTNDYYYTYGLEKYVTEDFIYYRHIDGNQIYMCYNAAHPSTWSSLFKIKTESDIEHMLEEGYQQQYNGIPGENGWYIDQEILYNSLHDYPHLQVLNRPIKRLEVDIFHHHLQSGDIHFISQYDDVHFHRSYINNETIILNTEKQLKPKKVLTFCLYGDNPIYNTGAILNAKEAIDIYTDFECWFYIHRETVPIETVEALEKLRHVRIIFKTGDLSIVKPRMWRFEAIDDPNVEVILSRDTDTRIWLREKAAVDEWLNSDCVFHIMRDHPYHFFPILAGMFGTKKIPEIPSWLDIIDPIIQNGDFYDQQFLEKYIYPIVKENAMIHATFHRVESNCRYFPVEYDTEYHFVGEYVYADNSRNETHIQDIKKEYRPINTSIFNDIDKTKEYIILLIGITKNTLVYVYFYEMFPNATFLIYSEDAIIDNSQKIDICYIHKVEHYRDIQAIIPMYQIDLLCNHEKIIHQNNANIIMYCIYHKNYYLREDTFYFCFFGVNETYSKPKDKNNILEYELDIYDPFLQKRGYMETSVYLHVYWNKLYYGREMIGFSQYDMRHHEKYNTLDKNTMYVLNTNESIVSNGNWHGLLFPHLRNIEFLLNSYNMFYRTNYCINDLENMPFTLWQTNIYPVKIYEKLCLWLELLVKDIYPWSNLPPYETHFGSIGGYTERAIAIFNAFEIYEGITYKNLNIDHGEGAFEKEQYNKRSFLNNYSQDIHTKFIENITGSYDNVEYSMFRAQYMHYACERVYKNGKNGLYFQKGNNAEFREYGFDIEAEDPRLVVCKDKVYVVFICLSPYENQVRTIGITEFDVWNPIYLQVENMEKNKIEKNWAPFVKEDKIYFVYNYDPLIILTYDFNLEGICNVVFTQDNIKLPIDTSETFLRGGSNLIHYKDGIYLGACHSRIWKDCFEHYTHIVLLDTIHWELIYVSKPVMYYYPKDNLEELNSWHINPGSKTKLDTFHNILMDKSPNIIQDPISIYINDDKYYITVNVRYCISLLYEISFANLLDLIEREKPVGYFDQYVKKRILLM